MKALIAHVLLSTVILLAPSAECRRRWKWKTRRQNEFCEPAMVPFPVGVRNITITGEGPHWDEDKQLLFLSDLGGRKVLAIDGKTPDIATLDVRSCYEVHCSILRSRSLNESLARYSTKASCASAHSSYLLILLKTSL